MHNPYDQFAKQLLLAALSPTLDVQTEVEVFRSTPKIDVVCIARNPPQPQAGLGLLGTLIDQYTLFEIFSRTPELDRVRNGLFKQYEYHHNLVVEANKQRKLHRRMKHQALPIPRTDTDPQSETAPLPKLLILGTGRPNGLIRGYSFRCVTPGVYRAPSLLSLDLVVLSELPRTRDTLLLRLFSRGRRLVEAMNDLKNLPDEAPEKTVVLPTLVQLEPFLMKSSKTEGETVKQDIQTWFREYKENLRTEGRGEGQRQILQSQLQSRFGRIPVRFQKILKAGSEAEVMRWADRVLTAQSLPEVFE